MTDVEAPGRRRDAPPRGSTGTSWCGPRCARSTRRGPHSLTMRGLGQDLGVEAMSLYRYVSGREDLLEAVVALLLDDFRTRPRRDHHRRPGRATCRRSPTPSGGSPSSTPPPSRSSPPGTRPRPGCGRRCAASSWSSSSCRRCWRTASTTTRPWTRTARSPASCSASCCSSRRPAARRRAPSRTRWTRAAPRSPTTDAEADTSANPTVVRLRAAAQRGPQRRGVRGRARDPARPPRDGADAVAARSARQGSQGGRVVPPEHVEEPRVERPASTGSERFRPLGCSARPGGGSTARRSP